MLAAKSFIFISLHLLYSNVQMRFIAMFITAVCVLFFYCWDRVCFSPIQPNSQISTERNPRLNSSSSMPNLDNAAFVYPAPPTCSSYTHSPSHDLRFLNRTTGTGRPTSKQVMLIWYPLFPHNMKLCYETCLDSYIEITTTLYSYVFCYHWEVFEGHH